MSQTRSTPDVPSGTEPRAGSGLLGGLERLSTDLHPPLSRHEASVESERCYFCHDAPCVTACPTGIDIPLFIRQISTGNVAGAAVTIFDENIFGGMCARVCPTETLCEHDCVRNVAEDRPVRIGELQRHATDALVDAGEHPYERAPSTGRRVAVVGAGPAGLACAHRLAMHGHEVVVHDALPKPGGLNEYGIAAYKTPNDFARREVDWLLSIGGIELVHDSVLGVDVTLEGLAEGFDATFVGLGLGAVNDLGVPGQELEGVEDAVDFIARLRQAKDPSTLEVGRRTVVIGGGMTAIDAAVQTKLLGAEDVTVVYRRGEERMNASGYERDLAKTNGVLIRTWLSPKRIVGSADDGAAGGVTGVEFDYMTDEGGPEAGGYRPTGETLLVPCDRVLRAIGQLLVTHPHGEHLELEGGRVKVDAERRTSDPRVWAGGDCAAGGEDLTVAAVQDGKLAAESIHRALSA